MIPPRYDRREIVFGVVMAGIILAGCATEKSAKTTPIHFVVEADQLVNPNESGDPSPVVVRIYELKATSTFNQAQFFDLLDNDAKVLGPDLVAKRELELKPGDRADFKRDTPVETRYVGVMAGFRTGDSSQWRKTADIEPERNNSIIVKVAASAISIEKEASRDWWKVF